MTDQAHQAAPYAPHPSQRFAAPGDAGRGSRASRIFALLALGAAILELVVGLVQSFAIGAIIASSSSLAVIDVVSTVTGIAAVLLIIAAAGLAITSLVRREPARLLAGIALGISIAAASGFVSMAVQTAAVAAR